MATPLSVLIKEPNERVMNHASFGEGFDVIKNCLLLHVMIVGWMDSVMFDSGKQFTK